MIKLHGIQISNYYNSAKLALLEKGIEFEEVQAMPRQDDEFISISPMGKVPCLEVNGKFLTETSVIFDLMEDVHPEPALYPADAFDRAKAKEILHYIELYVDLPARRLLPQVFFGAPANEAAVAEARPVLEKGLRSLRQLANFGPYFCGSTMTYADLAAPFHFGLANQLTQAVYGWDIVAELPGLDKCIEQVSARPHAQKTLGDLQKAMAAMQAK